MTGIILEIELRKSKTETTPSPTLLQEFGTFLKKSIGFSSSTDDSVSKNPAANHLPSFEVVVGGKPAKFDGKAEESTLHDLRRITSCTALTDCMKRFAQEPALYRSNFLQAVGSILADKEAVADEHMRARIVSDIIRQTAYPESIKEGAKGTCALATTELTLATERPDAYAASIADWIRFGKLVSFPSITDQPVGRSDLYQQLLLSDDGDKDRSLASKVFQTAAANLAVSRNGFSYEDFNPAKAPLIQSESGPYKPSRETGERLVNKEGRVLPWLGLTSDDQKYLMESLTGKQFLVDKIYPASSADLVSQLRALGARSHSPLTLSLHYVEGGHAITVFGNAACKDNSSVTYANTAVKSIQLRKLPALALYDTTIDGADVVRVGDPKMLDGYLYRRPAPLRSSDHPYVEVLHVKD